MSDRTGSRKRWKPFGGKSTGGDETVPEIEVEVEDTRPCPHCGGSVSRGATVCIHCERDLVAVMTPVAFSEFLRARQAPATPPDEEPMP